MFNCKICKEKDKQIEFLKSQNKDLQDRLMAFAKEAFMYYKQEEKESESLYPMGLDKDGKAINYGNTDPGKTRDEIFRAIGEEPITVDEPEEEKIPA